MKDIQMSALTELPVLGCQKLDSSGNDSKGRLDVSHFAHSLPEHPRFQHILDPPILLFHSRRREMERMLAVSHRVCFATQGKIDVPSEAEEAGLEVAVLYSQKRRIFAK